MIVSGEDKDKLFDDVVDAFYQSTGNLPDERYQNEIANLVQSYEDEESDD